MWLGLIKEGEHPVDLRLVTQKEASDDCEVDATSIEERVSFLSVAIEVCWHHWFAFCQCTGHSFICLVGCIYAHYKVNPNIFQFYFDFMDIFHHPPMHPLFHNTYEFYLFFYYFISSFIIYNNHLYLRQYFPF